MVDLSQPYSLPSRTEIQATEEITSSGIELPLIDIDGVVNDIPSLTQDPRVEGPLAIRAGFPEITEGQPYIVFGARRYEYSTGSFSTFDPVIEENGYVRLPLPPNLGTSYGATWNTQQTTRVDRVAGQVGQAARRGSLADLFATGGSESVTSEIMRGSAYTGASATISALASTGNNQAGVIRGLLYGAGVVKNPREAQMFESVPFRQHNFEYDLVPRNNRESNIINQIVRFFKFSMLPAYLGGEQTFFDYPFQFSIQFSSDVRPYLFEIGTSILTSFNVSYHGEGFSNYFNAGNNVKAPTTVKISLSFTETTILTRESVLNNNV